MARINIKEDPRNFNRHTSAGTEMIDGSVEQVGVIEAVTIASDNVIVSGHARNKSIDKVLGDEKDPIIVETDGTQKIVIKRTDIVSGTEKFYRAAALANTTAKANINLDEQLMIEVLENEFNVELIEVGYVKEMEISSDDEIESKTDQRGGFKSGESGVKLIIGSFGAFFDTDHRNYNKIKHIGETFLNADTEQREILIDTICKLFS